MEDTEGPANLHCGKAFMHAKQVRFGDAQSSVNVSNDKIELSDGCMMDGIIMGTYLIVVMLPHNQNHHWDKNSNNYCTEIEHNCFDH